MQVGSIAGILICLIWPAIGQDCGKIVINPSRRMDRREVAGGRDAEQHSWPWMVVLVRRRGQRNDYFCGGTIINKNSIITAAHCVLSFEPFFVRIGEHNYGIVHTAREDIGIADVIFHPKYQLGKGYHDIALLKLAKKITFRREAKPICLPSEDLKNEDLIDKTTILTGWGKLGYSRLASSVLQEVYVTVFDPSVCAKSYSTLPDYVSTFPEGMTSENMICAGHIDGGKDACGGDSGGPMMDYDYSKRRYSLAAVISKGFGCGKKDYPGLNSPIRNRETLRWIKRIAF